MTRIEDKPGPVEVWLSQANMTITAMVVHEDESTRQIGVDSLTMRGAQREVTGYLISRGFEPAGRWESALDDQVHVSESVECSRRFKHKERAGFAGPADVAARPVT